MNISHPVPAKRSLLVTKVKQGGIVGQGGLGLTVLAVAVKTQSKPVYQVGVLVHAMTSFGRDITSI